MKKLVLVLFSFFMVGYIVAMPYTSSGEIRVPDAYVLPSNMVEISYISFFSTLTDEGDYESDMGFVINGGIKDWVELGIVGTTSEIFYGNMKVQIIRETEMLPAIALGVDNFLSPIKNYTDDEIAEEEDIEVSGYYSDVLDKYDYVRNSIYGVMTKSTVMRGLPFIPYLDTKLHLGFGVNRFQGTTSLSKQLNGVFVGLEMKPMSNFGLVMEMDGYNINAGIKAVFKNVTINAGIYKLEELDRRPMKFALNLKYTFDMFSNVKFGEARNKTGYRQVMSSGQRIMNVDDFSNSNNSLDSEIESLRKQREQTEKELEKIRKLLEE